MASNETLSAAFETYIRISMMAGDDENSEDAALRAGLDSESFSGLNGLMGFSLSFLLDNVDSGLTNLTAYYNTEKSETKSVEKLFNEYLAGHTEIFDAIYDGGDIDVTGFTKQYNSTTGEYDIDDPIIESFMDSDSDIMAMNFKIFQTKLPNFMSLKSQVTIEEIEDESRSWFNEKPTRRDIQVMLQKLHARNQIMIDNDIIYSV